MKCEGREFEPPLEQVLLILPALINPILVRKEKGSNASPHLTHFVNLKPAALEPVP